MHKLRLTEFTLYSRINRVFDIKFRQSDKWPHWKRIPPMRCPLLYEKVKFEIENLDTNIGKIEIFVNNFLLDIFVETWSKFYIFEYF